MGKLKTKSRSLTADRVRTMAIVMVVLCHLRYLNFSPQLYSDLVFYFNSGVDIFFALSGFLITKKYYFSLTNISSATKFYLKRWRRTLPLYFLIMSLYLVSEYPDLSNFVYYLTFTQNYFSPNSWYVSWSLCVEEWFYLMYAPLAIGLKPYIKSPLIVFVVLASLAFFARLYTFSAAENESLIWFRDQFYGLTHIRFDGILIGCFFGVIRENKRKFSSWMELLFPFLIVVTSLCPVLFLENVTRYDLFSAVLLPTTTAILTGFWLWLFWDSQVKFFQGFFYLGSLTSYSVYLIHLPIIIYLRNYQLPFVVSIILSVSIISLLSVILFFKFEKIFIKK